jgi:protoheme ferro-lyase
MCIPPFDIYNLTDSREIVNHIFEVSLNFFPGSIAVAAQTIEESDFSDAVFIDLAPHPSVCTVIVVFVDLVYESVVTVNVVLVKVIERLAFEPDIRH